MSPPLSGTARKAGLGTAATAGECAETLEVVEEAEETGS